MEQLRGLPNSSLSDSKVRSNACWRVGMAAQCLASLSLRPLRFRDLALRWYLARSLRRSWVKASGRARCEWAVWSHLYRAGEMRVGEMTVPYAVWTPIMSLSILFHGGVGGTRDTYGPYLGMESLS